MIQFHQKNPALKSGDCQFLAVGEQPDVLAFLRSTEQQQAIAVFNRGQQTEMVKMPGDLLHFSRYSDQLTGKVYKTHDSSISVSVPGKEFVLLLSR